MNQLTLIPQGGLCNRLRAILSAASLVEEQQIDADIRVGWSASAECAARFDQLFLPLDIPRLQIASRRWYDRPITRQNLHWPALVRRSKYAAQFCNTPPAVDLLQRQLQSGCGAVYVSTGIAFCDYAPDYVRRLRLLPHLQAEVERLSAAFDAHTIGVHIRRTDHVTAIAESPDHLFEQALQDAISADPEAHFYIATDDTALKDQLAARFPSRVTVQDCRGTRSDLRGMEEAAIDLWTLARCSRIIGSYWSSFSDTAAELGGIPLTVIRK